MTLRAFVFDFDGLILDTETSEYETVREIYDEFGFELPLEAWQAKIGTESPHWLDELEELAGRLDDRDSILARRRTRHHERVVAEAVLPGVERMIDAAADAGILLAVASSSSERWVGGHLERLGLLDRFAHLSCRADGVPAKPAPDLYVAAIHALGVQASQAIAFEDSTNGTLAAKAAGLWCVAVPNGMTRNLDFASADLVVASLDDLDVARLRRLLGDWCATPAS